MGWLIKSWVGLEHVAHGNRVHSERAQIYVDLLELPLVVGLAREKLLAGLERITGQTFEGNIWQFMDWATNTEDGRKMNLRFGQ